jgi:hypothetical protein
VRSVIVDSGFLVALFDEQDPLHPRCREFLRDFRGRFLTTESVFAETLSLLSVDQQLRCLDWLGDAAQVGLLVVDRSPVDFRAVEKLTRKYSDQPMDFADAALVLLAMRAGVKEILTADERDFSVYRLAGKTRFVDLLRQT